MAIVLEGVLCLSVTYSAANSVRLFIRGSTMSKVKVQVRKDHLESIARGRRPVLALAELIWNALDADSTHVTVHFSRDLGGEIGAIEVSDNGTGIDPSEARTAFSNLGGSWKKTAEFTRKEQRALHGKEGKGRFQVFSLGTEVEWKSCFRDKQGHMHSVRITAAAEAIDEFNITEQESSSCERPGTTVIITGTPESASKLTAPGAREELIEIFAFYLRRYPEVQIEYDHIMIDPEAMEVTSEEFDLPPVVGDGFEILDAKLIVVEWKKSTTRHLYLCDASGFALHSMLVGIKAPNLNFTAYVRSAYFRKLHDNNELMLDELQPAIACVHEAAKNILRNYYQRRIAEQAAEVVDEWKRDRVYPYEGEPTSNVERSERQVFDVIAYNVNSLLPDFAGSDVRSKRFSFQLLKQAIETNPSSIQRILRDVLNLPKQKQDELAELLEHTSLGSVISAAKVVADRLNFLRALRALIFEPKSKKELLERSQLHRLVADHTWIFGEEYNLTVDDEDLTAVLARHYTPAEGEESADEYDRVLRHDGKRGIVDVMVSRALRGARPDQLEHLIVELKRPSQKITAKVLDQVEDYALAIARDDQFKHTKVRWVFWAVSNDLDEKAVFRSRQKGRPPGLVAEHEELRLQIWAKPWSEIIEDCRARLHFFERALNYSAGRETALASVRKTHGQYFPDSVIAELELVVAGG